MSALGTQAFILRGWSVHLDSMDSACKAQHRTIRCAGYLLAFPR